MPDFINVTCPLCECAETEPFHATDKTAFVRCADCGLIYQNPRPRDPVSVSIATTDEGVEYFTEKAFDPGKQRYYGRILRDLVRYRETGRLLEIGCATGGFLVAARDAGWQVYGIEISEAAAGIAKEKYDLDVFTGDISEANIEPECCDVVVMNMVVEHLADPVETLKKVALSLREGGALWLTTPNYNSDTIRLHPEPQYFPPDHYVLFVPGTVRTVLERAGLSIHTRPPRGSRRSPTLKKTAWSRFLDRLGAPLANLRRRGLRMKILAVKNKETRDTG